MLSVGAAIPLLVGDSGRLRRPLVPIAKAVTGSASLPAGGVTPSRATAGTLCCDPNLKNGITLLCVRRNENVEVLGRLRFVGDRIPKQVLLDKHKPSRDHTLLGE